MKHTKDISLINVKGSIAKGDQFDLDITLPNDYRSAIYGTVRDVTQTPVANATVKLFERVIESNQEVLKPVSHTFTDENGKFIFGPLCDDTLYEVQIWANDVKTSKVCVTCTHEGDCLHCSDLECPAPEETSCKKME